MSESVIMRGVHEVSSSGSSVGRFGGAISACGDGTGGMGTTGGVGGSGGAMSACGGGVGGMGAIGGVDTTGGSGAIGCSNGSGGVRSTAACGVGGIGVISGAGGSGVVGRIGASGTTREAGSAEERLSMVSQKVGAGRRGGRVGGWGVTGVMGVGGCGVMGLMGVGVSRAGMGVGVSKGVCVNGVGAGASGCGTGGRIGALCAVTFFGASFMCSACSLSKSVRSGSRIGPKKSCSMMATIALSVDSGPTASLKSSR